MDTGAHPSPDPNQDATVWLQKLSGGDAEAVERLLPLVYDQLRRIAEQQFRHQPSDHTLQPTALVHEAYLKLIGTSAAWKDRQHFCAVAATAMRQILIDHVRRKRAAKRDGQRQDVPLEEITTPSGGSALDIVALDDALTKLGELNARYTRMVELRFLGGMPFNEIAEHLHLSDRQLRKDWQNIRAWMNRELGFAAAP